MPLNSIALSRLSATVAELNLFLDEFGYDFARFTLGDFLGWLEGVSNCRLVVSPASLPRAVWGLWLTVTCPAYAIQVIFFNQSLGPLSQSQAILHEISHWLRGHPTQIVPMEELLAFSETGMLPPAWLLHVTQRSLSPIHCEYEWEAEALAILIQERAERAQRERLMTLPNRDTLRHFFQENGLL